MHSRELVSVGTERDRAEATGNGRLLKKKNWEKQPEAGKGKSSLMKGFGSGSREGRVEKIRKYHLLLLYICFEYLWIYVTAF